MSTTSSITNSSLSSLLSSGALSTIGNSASNTPTSLASSLAISGLASGMNWQNTVQELAQAERAPETQWKAQQTTLNTQNTAFTTIKNDLATLQADLQALQDPTLYQSATAQSSNSAVATAATASGAVTGSFTFNITRLATAAGINGTTDLNRILVPDGNPNDVTIGTAPFSTTVTAGTFTVNGAQINIASTDTLQDVFNKIAQATGNTVTASYDSASDTIQLSSSSAITLGSAADTSNFLQVAQLFNDNETSATDPVSNIKTYSIGSSQALGSVQLGMSMTQANLTQAITGDPVTGNGSFTINGVTINYNVNDDSIQNVLDRINSSSAGVTASFDSINKRFVLTNNSTGNVGISLQDNTGNFLQATGLSGGQFVSGQNLLYTLNNSNQQLVSQSNTITQASSGIRGLSVTALNEGTATVTVGSDTSGLSSAIQQFVTDYNAVQSYISSQQIVSTGSDGTVTPGTLTGDQTADDIVSSLRSLSFVAGSGLTGPIQTLGDLGIQSNGQDNTLSLSDTSTLNNALASNLSAVQSFFADATNGVATQLNNYVTSLTASDGELTNHQAALTQQYNNLGTQITNLETKITSDSAHWTTEFQAMEQAQQQANQELTYLSEQITNGSL